MSQGQSKYKSAELPIYVRSNVLSEALSERNVACLPSFLCRNSMWSSAPHSIHGVVVHTWTTYFPTGFLEKQRKLQYYSMSYV